jgi:integrase
MQEVEGSIPFASTVKALIRGLLVRAFLMYSPDVAIFSVAFRLVGYDPAQSGAWTGRSRLTRRQKRRSGGARRSSVGWRGVRFPDGSRRKVERVEKADAEADLNELLALRAAGGGPLPRRERMISFNEVLDEWLEAGCPSAAPGARTRHARQKSEATIDNARRLLATHVRPGVGVLWVDRTRTERVEKLFARMSDAGLATSTVDHTWDYLNQACRHALRRQRIRTNPVQDALLPEARPPKDRKALTVEQAGRILFDAIPEDRNPAMWLTGLMCGLRPGELAGLRWPFVDIDSEEPAIEVAERAREVSKKYVGQASPKTKKSRRRIGLHPLLVAALQRHRHDMQMLGLYDPGSFVFCTRNGTPFLLRNMRRDFGRLCERAGLGSDWTT